MFFFFIPSLDVDKIEFQEILEQFVCFSAEEGWIVKGSIWF